MALAYAAFLSEPNYVAMAKRLPRVLPYDLARDEFDRARPWLDGRWDEGMSNADAARTYGVGGDPPR